jgi:hypothetical protein
MLCSVAPKVITVEMLAAKFGTILPQLDERQRRLLPGVEARALGHGGIRLVARAAGVRAATVPLGVSDLEGEAAAAPGRVRRPGGGRKRSADLDPGLVPALLALVEPEERGDPVPPLRWTVKSARALAAGLSAQGHRVPAGTVAGLLRGQGFSLQGNAKVIGGSSHPDRDAQFRCINGQASARLDASSPPPCTPPPANPRPSTSASPTRPSSPSCGSASGPPRPPSPPSTASPRAPSRPPRTTPGRSSSRPGTQPNPPARS